MRAVLLTAAAAALLGACFNPDYPANLPCDPTGWCPPGQTCNVRNICVADTGDGDGGVAGIDGNPADAGHGALTAIDIGADVTIAVGDTYQFTVTGTYADGSTMEITDFAIWDSSDMAVMYVDFMGLAHGQAAGQATARARYGGRVDTALVTVTAP